MQRRLALVGASALAVALAGSASAMPPVAHYLWAQPGNVGAANPGAQPPSWIPITSTTTFVLVPPAYRWAQPWGWSPATESAQPVL